jgi:hypothetical protein
MYVGHQPAKTILAHLIFKNSIEYNLERYFMNVFEFNFLLQSFSYEKLFQLESPKLTIFYLTTRLPQDACSDTFCLAVVRYILDAWLESSLRPFNYV